jgi:hypothetical protein
VRAYALYRIAAAHARLGDRSSARDVHARLTTELASDSAVPDREALAAAARRDACGLSR